MATDASNATSKIDSQVNRARAGDRAAFSALVQAHDAQMRALVFTTINTDSGMDDILQTAYLNAYRAMGRFRADAKFSTWLHRIVYNAAIDHVRKVNRRRETHLEPVLNTADDDAAHDKTLAERDALTQALDTLSPDHRACVLLVDAHGHDYQSAADILEVSEGTVASRLSRARAHLRRELDLNGGGRS